MLKDDISRLAKELYDETVTNRRYLHSNPELSFKEYNTAVFVESRLSSLGIPFERKANTGIVALLTGTKEDSEKVIALRADMDALPIPEANEVEYASKSPGVMHACGHDAHTASLLAVAGILSQLKAQFSGTVKFIFQPAEETLPGGAGLMIQEGALENPKPGWILGQHVMPELPAGKVGFRPGYYMACNDEIYITVIGKGGHAAMPHLNIDPVSITCQLITALQQVVSRQANPLIPSVLSFGKIIANGAVNVIPDKVEIEGTFRTFNEEWRENAHQKIKEMTIALVEGMGAKCEIEIRKGYPVLTNEEELTLKMRQLAEDYLGPQNVVSLDLWMAAEDFAFYGQKVPACFYRLGVGNEAENETRALHTPSFDINESSLETGSGLMAWLALKGLGN